MKRCSKCGEDKPLDEFPPRKDSKDGHRGACYECRNSYHREYTPKWKANNPGKCAAYTKKSRLLHLEERRAWDREYVKNNREKKSKAFRDWRRRNPEKAEATYRRNYNNGLERSKRWRKNNPHIVAIHAANRRHLEQIATPPWVLTDQEHLDKIKEIYLSAKVATEFHEESYHVDHIHPLKGVNENNEHVSCGLHVFWNLQVLYYRDNLSKKNKLYDN